MKDDPEIDDWRRRERRRLLAERMAMTAEQHQAWSAAVERRLWPLLEALPGRVVGIYWPVRAEFDPRPLAERLRRQGRRLALPAIDDRHGPLAYRAWESGMEMTTGVHGIPVPKEHRPLGPEVLLVPLLGFDDANYRLGYGGGYFDRTIAALRPRPVAIGIGAEAGRLDSIFPQPHDIPMDIVVTEARLKRKGGA